VDWEQIAAVTEQLESGEQAIGCAVLLAHNTARQIRDEFGAPEPTTAPSNGNGAVVGLQTEGVDLTRLQPWLAPVPTEPPEIPAMPMEPTAAPRAESSPVTSAPMSPITTASTIPTSTEPAPPISAAPTQTTTAPDVSVAPTESAQGSAGWTFVVSEPTLAPETAHPADTRTAAAKDRRRLRRLHVAFAGFGWVRNIGLILILFAVWQLWGTAIEHAHDQASLHQQFEAHVHQATRSPTEPVLVPSTVRLPEPAEGSVVARLQIPAIGVDQYVVEGTAEGDLAKGPGHYIGTAMPGQAGNVAIAGHRTTYGAPFNSLDHLVTGDPITLTTLSGEALTYVVSQAPVAVSPHDISVLNTFDDNRLTLTTCNPKFSASQRLVVVATLRLPAAATPAPRVVPHKVHVVVGSTGWNVVYFPGVLLVVALLVLLGLANRRASALYGRAGRWVVLSPIWAVLLYFLFVLLTKLLPAAL
jgi:sortase A